MKNYFTALLIAAFILGGAVFAPVSVQAESNPPNCVTVDDAADATAAITPFNDLDPDAELPKINLG